MAYNPEPETAEILNWMLKEVKSVPYGVTLRWAFYQCVQELGLQKKDYKRIKSIAAKARKNFWNGWNPETLVDDTRTIHNNGGGYRDFQHWLESFRDRRPVYESYSSQESIVQIWFEAQAMYSQFEHYASPYRIDLVPFKGDTSINHKWKIAEHLASLYRRYRKPIIVLYFGDYEPHRDRGSRAKGITIPLDALKDIRIWLYIQFIKENVASEEEAKELVFGENSILTFIRIGLNQEHVDQWNLPENPERPGEYQWEALGDEQARELITSAIESYQDVTALSEIREREENNTEQWKEIVDKWLESLNKENQE